MCWLNDDCVFEGNHEGACKFKSWFVEDTDRHIMGGPIDVTTGDVIQTIGRWSARRREPLHDPDKEYTYECRVRFNDEQWDTEFVISHTYAHGAGVLVGKVFARYAEIKARAAKRKADQLAREKRTPPSVPTSRKSERLHEMELEKDLLAIKHREEE